MNIKKLNIVSNIFLAVGIAIFAYLVWSFGFDKIWTNLQKTGLWFIPIVLVWFVIFILNTATWYFILKDRFKGLSYIKAFMITTSGFAFNYLTPVVNLGGEPLKIVASRNYLGTKPATSSVILFTLLHQYAHFWVWLAAAVWFAFNMSLSNPFNLTVLILTIIAVSMLIFLFSKIFKKGLIVFLFKKAIKIPLLKNILKKFKDKEGALAKVDELITDFYNNRRKDFYTALVIEIVARVMMSFEFYFILRSINIEISFLESYYIMAASSLFVNLVFFVPMQLGSKEASLYFIMNSLGLNPFLGVYTAIVVRLREFFWIGVGLLFIKMIGFKPKPDKSLLDYVNNENHKNHNNHEPDESIELKQKENEK